MIINYNCTGAERKKLIAAISEITECSAKYLGAPTFAYEADYFTIDKNGSLSFDDRADTKEIEQLIEALCEKGFEAEIEEAENCGLVIQMPKSLFTETAIDNLRKLVDAKGGLIKKAIGINELPITEDEDKISFPWVCGEPDADEVKAYTHLITALCEMARNQKRISAKEKITDNDKYAFRCFLLRLGFIGNEYKEERKILLRNLTGSSAFKGGAKNEISK